MLGTKPHEYAGEDVMKNCDMGCKHFMCESIGHLKSCPNYPDSMQQMIDDKNDRIEKLTRALEKIVNVNAMDYEYVQWAKDGLKERADSLQKQVQKN